MHNMFIQRGPLGFLLRFVEINVKLSWKPDNNLLAMKLFFLLYSGCLIDLLLRYKEVLKNREDKNGNILEVLFYKVEPSGHWIVCNSGYIWMLHSSVRIYYFNINISIDLKEVKDSLKTWQVGCVFCIWVEINREYWYRWSSKKIP